MTISNKDLIVEFLVSGRYGSTIVRGLCNYSLRISLLGDILYVGRTAIAQWKNNVLYVNVTQYSDTIITRHQRLLNDILEDYVVFDDITTEEVNDVIKNALSVVE